MIEELRVSYFRATAWYALSRLFPISVFLQAMDQIGGLRQSDDVFQRDPVQVRNKKKE